MEKKMTSFFIWYLNHCLSFSFYIFYKKKYDKHLAHVFSIFPLSIVIFVI